MIRVDIQFKNGNKTYFIEEDYETAEEKMAILTDAAPGQITEISYTEI